MTAPNLFVLGAQKAGTTYLAQMLSQHPEVFFSDPKETMFFSRKRTLQEEDYREYCRSYFRGATENRPRFTLKELERLQERFLPDLRRTGELTGLDLSEWYALPQFAPHVEAR